MGLLPLIDDKLEEPLVQPERGLLPLTGDEVAPTQQRGLLPLSTAPDPIQDDFDMSVLGTLGGFNTYSVETPGPKKDPTVSSTEEVKKSLVRGLFSIPEAVATGIRAFATLIEDPVFGPIRKGGPVRKQISRDLEQIGLVAEITWRDAQKPFSKHRSLNKRIFEHPEMIRNLDWWLANTPEAGVTMLASLLPAMGAKRILDVGRATAGLAKLGAVLVGGATGGWLEGAPTYREVLRRGGSKREALRDATMMAGASALLNAIAIDRMLGGGKLVSGFTEAITEWLEAPTEGTILYQGNHIDIGEFFQKMTDELDVMGPAGLLGIGGATMSGNRSIQTDLDFQRAIKQMKDQRGVIGFDINNTDDLRNHADATLQELNERQAKGDHLTPSEVDEKIFLTKNRGNDVKLAEFYSQGKVNIYYSKAEQVLSSGTPNHVNKLPNKTLPGPTWTHRLLQTGVKQQELDWMGFSEFLEENPNPNKSQVLDFVQNSRLRIVEDHRQGQRAVESVDNMRETLISRHTTALEESSLKELTMIYRQEFPNGEKDNKLGMLGKLSFKISDDIYVLPGDRIVSKYQAEFGTFDAQDVPPGARPVIYPGADTTLPGGKNYQERLIRAPDLHRAKVDGKTADEWLLTATNARNDAEIDTAMTNHRLALQRTKQPFTHFHWIGANNVLAHFRMDDRIGENGERILFLQELQSDYAAKIRDLRAQIAKVPELQKTLEQVKDSPVIAQATRTLINEAERAGMELSNIPDYPLDTWHKLPIRRILKYATENGYDKISWVNSDEVKTRDASLKDKDWPRQLYDERIPNALAKIGKRYGAKLGDSTFYGRTFQSLNITDSMRESIAGEGVVVHAGLPLGNIGKYIPETWKLRVKEFFSPFSTLPESLDILFARSQHFGFIGRTEHFIKNINSQIVTFPLEVRKDILRYLDGQIDITDLPVEARKPAKSVLERTKTIGRALVKRKLLPQSVWDETHGKYIHYMYARDIIGDDGLLRFNQTGKLDMDYIFEKNKDLTQEQRRELGMIEDAAVAIPIGMGKALADIGKFDYMEQVANNPNWTWRPGLVELGGKFVGVGMLVNEIKRQEQVVRLQPDNQDAVNRLNLLNKKMQDEQDISGNVPFGYKQMPMDEGYGPLAGAYIRKPIADDLLPLMTSTAIHRGDLFGALVKIEQEGMVLFKEMKVALNLPTVSRNVVSNVIQNNMRGRALAYLPGDYTKAFQSFLNKDQYFIEAKRNGLFMTNWSIVEINNALAELEKVSSGNWGSFMKAMGNLAQYYGKIDDFSKLAIYHQMRRDGASQAESTIEAQKWGMDYSLASRSIKEARRHFLPFATYQYKIAPLILESLTKRPWVIGKYFGIIFALVPEIVKEMHDLDEDEWMKMKKDLPRFMTRNRTFMVYPWKSPEGNWQWVDMQYFFPWGNYWAMGADATRADGGELVKDIGIGNPFLTVLTAMTSGALGRPPKDPYTGQDLYSPLDSSAVQYAKMMEFIYNTWMPSMFTGHGAAGHTYKAVTGEKDKYGRTTSPGAAFGRWFGINLQAVSQKQVAVGRRSDVRFLNKALIRDLINEKDPKKQKRIKARYNKRIKEALGRD